MGEDPIRAAVTEADSGTRWERGGAGWAAASESQWAAPAAVMKSDAGTDNAAAWQAVCIRHGMTVNTFDLVFQQQCMLHKCGMVA